MKKIFIFICVLIFTLNISPIAHAETNNPCPIINKKLSLGSKGSQVFLLQKFLKENNFFTEKNNTNFFGKKTKNALIKFQKENNLNPTGVVDQKTILKISSKCTSINPTISQEQILMPPALRVIRGWSIPDTTPPNVTISSPTDNTYTTGNSLQIHADASDNFSVASVQFQIDNTPIGDPVTTAPYEITWDFGGVSAGVHTISATARDFAGNSTTSSTINVVTRTHTVGGTLSGLTGDGLVLQNNGADDLSISSNGSLTFPTPITEGSSYAVTILHQPSGQTCVVTNGSGTMGASNVSNISISCASRLLSITVTPNNSILPRNINKQFTAIGLYADSSSLDITTSVSWDTSSHTIATINGTGLATGVSVGTTQVSATLGDVVGTTTLTVNNATLVAITISPSNPAVARGSTIQLSAIGTFSDGSSLDITNQSTWTSTNTNVATINNTDRKGEVTGVSGGSTVIHANLNSITGNATLFAGN